MSPTSPQNPYSIFKKALLIFIPFMLLACSIAGFILYTSNNAEHQTLLTQQKNTVSLRVSGINKDIAAISTVLLILANSENVEHLWDFSGNPLSFVLERLTNDFINVARFHKIFDQIRLLDEFGVEIIRVNYKDDMIKVVPKQQLQNKKGRYYFDDAIQLNRGQVFVSPLDLNVEHGQVEVPLKPMIRFATPVFDQRGIKRGIILLNYFGADLIARFTQNYQSGQPGKAMILNREGYWLKSPVVKDEWGFMFDDLKHITFGATYPDEWAQLQDTENGQFETEAGLFTFETVYPLKQGQFGQPMLTALNSGDQHLAEDDFYWKIISHIAADDLYSTVNHRYRMTAWILMLMTLIIFPASWWIARSSLREKSAARERLLHSTALNTTNNSVLIIDRDGVIEWVNQSMIQQTGKSLEQLKTLSLVDLLDDNTDQQASLMQALKNESGWQGELIYLKHGGEHYPADTTLTPVFYEADKALHFIAIIRDLSEKKALETQLLAAQKMESVGQLAAGIAHEINTPTQFVGDNISFLKQVIEDYINNIDQLQLLHHQSSETGVDKDQLLRQLNEIIEDIDVDFIRKEAPDALEQSQEGLSRISKIVSAMKDFSHPGDTGMSDININHIIETTVTIARNEWKYVANLETHLDPDLPTVPADSQLIGQVILNMIVNAAHAIGEKITDQDSKGLIEISTRKFESNVEIEIADNGIGIPPALINRIFEPFFTTKEVGKGSGQGLAIAYAGIVEKHKGSIDVTSSKESGTHFIIRLPSRK